MRLTANKRNILQQSILSVNDGVLSAISVIMIMSGQNFIRPWIGVVAGGLLAMGSANYISVSAIANQQNKYSPNQTVLFSSIAYFIGAIIPVIPLIFINNFIASLVVSFIFLLVIGYKNNGKTNKIVSAIRQGFLGIFVAVVTYYLGLYFG